MLTIAGLPTIRYISPHPFTSSQEVSTSTNPPKPPISILHYYGSSGWLFHVHIIDATINDRAMRSLCLTANPLLADQSTNVLDAMKQASGGPGDHLWEDNWDDDDVEDDFTKQLR